MTIVTCDLDNTLLYSHKKEIAVPKTCVEYYQGKPITYMTDATAELLIQAAGRILFVPVTTRTVEQYKRIHFPVQLPYALVCNGGVLLKQGKEMPQWYQETKKLVEASQMELQKGERLLEKDKNRSFELRRIREMFLFTKSDNPAATVAYLKERLDSGKVDVYANGAKIYVLPKLLTKGEAVRRFKKYLNPAAEESYRVLAAGDSVFDISMLEEADCGYIPEALQEEHGLPATVQCLKGEIFSEKLLRQIISFSL